MNRHWLITSTMAVLLALTAVTATASEISIGIVFSDKEKSLIRDYYRQEYGQQSAGGRGGKGLPPGIAKNLRRGKPLPPGIAKQALPGSLIALLPPAPRGYERIEVAGKILLVEIATQVIHDVLEDMVFH